MPLDYIKTVDPDGVLSIWKCEEPIDYFYSRLNISGIEEKLIATLSDRKQYEWLASRYLLHIMTGQRIRKSSFKDDHGKLILHQSDYHISLSHSGAMAAVIASKQSVGVDIQLIVNKIGRISRKFCNEVELSNLSIESELLYYHLIWGAKECIYKSYGKRKVDFKSHMTIDRIDQDLSQGICRGRLHMPSCNYQYQITYKLMDDYFLVYSVQK